MLLFVSIALLIAAPPPAAADNNLHLIESLPNGFAIYRSGKPDSGDVAEYCRLGIEEMAVLAGNADRHELRYRDACPALEIVYDQRQDADIPLTAEFLEWFDEWVESARQEGKKIAFRCNCGCHRTGRLAAYYQMKYQNLTVESAIAIMIELGENWARHRNIPPQVRALKDYLDGKACSQNAKYCVRPAERGQESPVAVR